LCWGFTIRSPTALGADWMVGLPRRLIQVLIYNGCYLLGVVSSLQHLKDLGELGVTMEVMSGGW
jgi:hypothetical protein